VGVRPRANAAADCTKSTTQVGRQSYRSARVFRTLESTPGASRNVPARFHWCRYAAPESTTSSSTSERTEKSQFTALFSTDRHSVECASNVRAGRAPGKEVIIVLMNPESALLDLQRLRCLCPLLISLALITTTAVRADALCNAGVDVPDGISAVG